MKKRARLTITSAALPSTVNNIRVYIGLQSNAAPYAYLQGTSTTGSNTMTFTSVGSLTSGTGAPTTSTYASLNPASIQSTNSELIIKADGTIGLGTAVGGVQPLRLDGTTGSIKLGTSNNIVMDSTGINVNNSATLINADGTAKVKGLIAYSAIDADTTTGNRPALILGDTASTHMRMDGDEIIAMTNDTTQGTLSLNQGGQTNTSRLVVTSTTDATNTAGNLPPLRVGDTAGVHLRMDGNEIIAMNTDTAQGALLLNMGGQVRFGVKTWQTGTVAITPTAANTTTTVSVTFPTAFSGSPIVMFQPLTGAGSTVTVNLWPTGTSATGFDLNNNASNVTTRTIRWLAVDM
jgi:hypothetical protein